MRDIRRKAHKSKRKEDLLMKGLIVFGCLFVVALYFVLTNLCVKRDVTVEVGDRCPKVSEFLEYKDKNAYFTNQSDSEKVFEKIGEHEIKIHIFGRNVTATVHVVDTIAPDVVTKEVTVYPKTGDEYKKTAEPDDFIEKIVDKTSTKVTFEEEPDCTTEGSNKVLLSVKDEGGNITKAEAKVNVVYDHEAPVIKGVKILTMTIGGSVSYKKGITVTDNFDKEVSLEVDTSKVDTSKEGTYEVTYSATDISGNEATVTTTLQVRQESVQGIDSADIDAAADAILASIINDSMSLYEKAEKIFWWCHNSIAYSDNTPMIDYTDAAYRGLVKRKGDCYTYAMTAKCLLTRANITNMDISRIPSGNSRHYWNLIDIGEGWRHFDTCRRADGSSFFYKTDAEVKAYSDRNNGTHNYDRSLYPTIP